MSAFKSWVWADAPGSPLSPSLYISLAVALLSHPLPLLLPPSPLSTTTQHLPPNHRHHHHHHHPPPALPTNHKTTTKQHTKHQHMNITPKHRSNNTNQLSCVNGGLLMMYSKPFSPAFGDIPDFRMLGVCVFCVYLVSVVC